MSRTRLAWADGFGAAAPGDAAGAGVTPTPGGAAAGAGASTSAPAGARGTVRAVPARTIAQLVNKMLQDHGGVADGGAVFSKAAHARVVDSLRAASDARSIMELYRRDKEGVVTIVTAPPFESMKVFRARSSGAFVAVFSGPHARYMDSNGAYEAVCLKLINPQLGLGELRAQHPPPARATAASRAFSLPTQPNATQPNATQTAQQPPADPLLF